jgi:tRNA G18 (ribose-2'-O)-methylase SpoU
VPSIIPIATPDDPRIADYHEIRERDLRGRGDRFIVEGEVVVRTLLSRRSLYAPESLLISERRLSPMAPLIGDTPKDVPIYVASPDILNAIAGFPIHRGVLAMGRRTAPADAAALLRPLGSDALVLGLVGIANHDNMGGLFRNAAAFGVHAVLLDDTCCDPLYRKAIRVSAGASLAVPFARAGAADALLASLHACGFEPLALAPAGREPVEAVGRAGRTALLLGAEGAGLPPSLLEQTRTVRIAMAPGFDSLNVATASGIALHRLAGLRPQRSEAAAPLPGDGRR